MSFSIGLVWLSVICGWMSLVGDVMAFASGKTGTGAVERGLLSRVATRRLRVGLGGMSATAAEGVTRSGHGQY